MRNFTISIGGSGDLEAVETLETRCFSEIRRSSRRMLGLSLRSPSQRVWIAWNRDGNGGRKVAGCVILHLRRHSVRVYSLAVMPAFRGGGMGRMLMETAISEAKRRQARYVSLEADCRNRRLLHWYSRFGFEPVRVLPDYYTAGWDAVLMRLPIDRAGEPVSRKTI